MSFLARLHAAIPPFRETAISAFAWSILVTASVVYSLFGLGWQSIELMTPALLIVFFGSLLSWPVTRYFSRLFAPVPDSTRRIAADIVLTPTFSVLGSAAIYALVFRSYYAQWHGEIFSPLWIYSFVFTIAGAVYSFVVLALPMMLPGFSIALVAYILWKIACRR